MGRDLLQEHQNQDVLLLIKEPEAGHLDLPGAPLTLQVAVADDTDGLAASVDAVHNVVYDGFAWLEVPVVETQLPTLFSLQLWQKLPQDPGLIVGVVGNEGIVLTAMRLVLIPLLGVIEESQEEVIAVNDLPFQEVVGKGCYQGEEDQTSGRDVEEVLSPLYRTEAQHPTACCPLDRQDNCRSILLHQQLVFGCRSPSTGQTKHHCSHR